MTTYAEELKAATPVVTITPAPLVFEKVGEAFRGLYLGQREFSRVIPATGEIKTNRVAHFYDGAKVLFNMGAQLTRALEVLNPGVSVEIILTELKANQHSGKTKIYSISPLNIPTQNMAELFGGLLNIGAPAPQDLLPPPEESGNGNGPRSMRERMVERYNALREAAVPLGIEAEPVESFTTDAELRSAGVALSEAIQARVKAQTEAA